MTESTDQTRTAEDFTPVTTDQLVRLLTDRIQSYGEARDQYARSLAAGNVHGGYSAGPAWARARAAVDALAARVESARAAADQAEALLSAQSRPAEPTEAERAAYVRTGLLHALDLATATAKVTEARLAGTGYRDLLAAELAAMDALTAHLAAR